MTKTLRYKFITKEVKDLYTVNHKKKIGDTGENTSKL